ncbi:MAG: hypothetical protein OXQ93_02905 [Gemmatimonadota bacterium]|nr:hypothetical protein [Gemmatimonadota bacterium]
MRPTIPPPSLLLALATTQACGIDAPTEEALQAAMAGAHVPARIEDSAGVRVVTYEGTPTATEELLEPIEAEYGAGVRRVNPGLPDAQVARVVQTYIAPYERSIGRPLPLFSSPLADAEGRVWLPSYRVSRGLTRTDMPPHAVIAPNGEWLGVVEAPSTFRLLDVAGGLVLGKVLDEMDVVSVVVYGLVDPAHSRPGLEG